MHIDNKAYSCKDSLQYLYIHKIVVRQLLWLNLWDKGSVT